MDLSKAVQDIFELKSKVKQKRNLFKTPRVGKQPIEFMVSKEALMQDCVTTFWMYPAIII